MITSALNCAVEQHLIPANPTKGCVLPKLEKKEMNILPPESLSTFFEEARKSNVFELYYIDLATGLRRGELLRLKWSDVDLDKGIIHVRRQVLRQNGAERRVCLPITVRRPNVAGHRSPYASTTSVTQMSSPRHNFFASWADLHSINFFMKFVQSKRYINKIFFWNILKSIF